MDCPGDRSVLDEGTRREDGEGCILGTEPTELAAGVNVGGEREREREKLRDSQVSGYMGAFYGNGETWKRSRHCVGWRKLYFGQVIFKILTQHSKI